MVLESGGLGVGWWEEAMVDMLLQFCDNKSIIRVEASE
jgi:hypothetical protein